MKKILSFICGALILGSTHVLAQPAHPAHSPTMNPSQSTASNQIHWLRNYSEATSLSQSTSKPIVILLTGTNWCPACMKLEREVLTRPEFAQALNQKFIFLKAEFPDYSEASMMTSPYKPLLDRYGVDAFPTIVVINANGEKLFTVEYQEGGPQYYIQELLRKLNQSGAPGANQNLYSH